MEHILITGAGGAIGSRVSKYLSNLGYNLILNYYNKDEICENMTIHKIVIGDISDMNTIHEIFKNDITAIIHLASHVNPLSYEGLWKDAYSFSVNSTFGILDFLKDYKKPIHIIFPSSGGTVYSTPKSSPFTEDDDAFGTSPYGIQKIMFENYLHLLTNINKNITANILRISNPYGLELNPKRNQGLIDTAIMKIKNNETVEIWSPPETIRDYIHIDDLCVAFLKAYKSKDGFNIFNIGSGTGASIKQIIDALSSKHSFEYKFTASPFSYYLNNYNVLDISKARKILDFHPKCELLEKIKDMV